MIILVDGNCNLCNGIVRLLKKADKQNRFTFYALPNKINIPDAENTVVVKDGEKYYYRAKAVFHILKHCSFPYKFLMVFNLLPDFLLEKIYRFIATNRYKWFGKNDVCQLPVSPLKSNDNELTQ